MPYDSEAARAALYEHHLFRAWTSPLNTTVKLITLKVDEMLSLAQARGCAEASVLAQALGAALPAATTAAAASSSRAGSSSQQQQQEQQRKRKRDQQQQQQQQHKQKQKRDHQQQQQQEQPSASAMATLRAGVRLVWPGSHPLYQLRRVAAEALLDAPGMAMNKPRMGQVFFRARQARQELQDLRIERILDEKHFRQKQLLHGDVEFSLDLVQLCSSIEGAVGRQPAAAAAPAGPTNAAAGTSAAAAPRLSLQPLPAPVPLLQPQPAAGGASTATGTTAVGTAVPPPPLLAAGASLQQLEADAAAAQVQLISGPGSGFDAMLGHLGACSALGIDLETGRAGGLCLLQV
jgi:hypothetical protein